MGSFCQCPFSFTGCVANQKQLSNFHIDERTIGVGMTPLEVLLLLASIDPVELAIVPMLLLEIGAVSMIFVAVPRMVVVALSIVVAFFGVIVVISSCYRRADQDGAQRERAHNQETTHVDPHKNKDRLLAIRPERQALVLAKSPDAGH